MNMKLNPFFQATTYSLLLVLALVLSYFLLGTLPQAFGITLSNLDFEIIYVVASCWYILFVFLLNKKWDIHLKNYLHFKFRGSELFFTVVFSIAASVISIMIIDSVENWLDLIAGKINAIKIVKGKGMLYSMKILRTVLIVPFFEELFFRGILLTFLLRKIPDPKAILLVAFLFAVSHVKFDDFLMLFFDGIVFGYLFYQTKSLWVSTISHSLTNFILLNVEFEKVTIGMLDYWNILLLCLSILLIIGLIAKQKYFILPDKDRNE